MLPTPAPSPQVNSLVWATDIDLLPLDRQIVRRDGYWVIRSPSNPTHWWGNFLLLDRPPAAGDGAGWERCFSQELGGASHQALGWDSTAGPPGPGCEEFLDHGYVVERTTGLLARPGQLRLHPRANREISVRALLPAPGQDQDLWRQVIELQVAGRDEAQSEEDYRKFSQARQRDLRDLFRAGRGAWYVALCGNEVVGSCGIVVTEGRARYQTVDTAAAHRRRGICSRLLVEAAAHAARTYRARQFVIAADPDYHAVEIYESLGFLRCEEVAGLLRRPPAEAA